MVFLTIGGRTKLVVSKELPLYINNITPNIIAINIKVTT
jgi:hypothetical protein